MEHAHDRKDRRESNRYVATLKKEIAALTSERDSLIARYEPHNVPNPAKPSKVVVRQPIPFAAHAYAVKKFAEAVEDIGAGFGADYETDAERYDSYWAMFVDVSEGLPRPAPQTDAEADEAYAHYSRMWRAR